MSQRIPRVKPNNSSGRKPCIPPRLNKQHYYGVLTTHRTRISPTRCWQTQNHSPEEIPCAATLDMTTHSHERDFCMQSRTELPQHLLGQMSPTVPGTCKHLNTMSQHCQAIVEAQFKQDFHSIGLLTLHEGFAGCTRITVPHQHTEVGFYTTSMYITQWKLCFFSDLSRIFLYSIQVYSGSFPFPSPQSFFGVIAFESHFKN